MSMLTHISGKGISPKMVLSHHYGFGNLQVCEETPSQRSMLTGLESSGKFQQRLMLKQTQLEVSHRSAFIVVGTNA